MVTPKQDLVVPFAAIQAVAILDDLPKDTKGRVLLYLHLNRCPSQTHHRFYSVVYQCGSLYYSLCTENLSSSQNNDGKSFFISIQSSYNILYKMHT